MAVGENFRSPVPAREWTQALHTRVWWKDKRQRTNVGKESIHFGYDEEKIPNRTSKMEQLAAKYSEAMVIFKISLDGAWAEPSRSD